MRDLTTLEILINNPQQREHLREILKRRPTLEAKYGLRCQNVFHAGDGNLHPLILFDANEPDQLRRTEELAAEVLEKLMALKTNALAPEKLDTFDSNTVEVAKESLLMISGLVNERLPERLR